VTCIPLRRSSAAGDSTLLRRPHLMVTILLLALLAVACAAEEPADEPDPEPADEAPEDDAEGAEQLSVAYVPATTGLVLHVAHEEGFFEDHGIEADLTEAQNISEIIPALGQQFDISLGTATDLIRAGDAGLDVVQISGNTISTEDNPFARIIARDDAGIESFADLQGARVASPTIPGVINMGMLYGAQQEGVDPDTIEVIQVPPPNHPDQLQAGQVDVSQALEPFATSLVAAGHVVLGDPFSVIADPLATNFWIADGQWARDNVEVVERFREALEEATEFLEAGGENEERAREILQDFTGMPPEVAQNVVLPTFDLEIREDDLQIWVEVLQELDEPVDVDTQDLILEEAGEEAGT